jgi:hypothetical protein
MPAQAGNHPGFSLILMVWLGWIAACAGMTTMGWRSQVQLQEASSAAHR